MVLCERFRCLPSALLAEDAELFRMVRMVDREREVNGQGGGGGFDQDDEMEGW